MKITVNKKRLTGKQLLALVLSFLVMTTVMSHTGPEIQAASKPGTPKLTNCVQVGNKVSINWTKAKNAKTYNVYKVTGTTWKYWKKVKKSQKKKYSNTGKYKLVKTGSKYKVYKKAYKYSCIKKGLKARTYKFTGTYSTTYKLAVRAYNGKKAGNYSAIETVTTGAKPAPPTPPTPVDPTPPSPATIIVGTVSKLTVTASEVGDTMELSWTPAENATSYEVEVSTGDDGAFEKCQDTAKTSITLSAAQYSTEYTYRVRGVNGTSTGEYSTSVSCLSGKDPATVPPGKVTGVRVTADGNVITVKWKAVPYANDYQVYYKGPNDGSYTAWATTNNLSKVSNSTKFKYSTTYSFKVRARNNKGAGEFSDVVSCTTGKDPASLEPGEFSSDPDEAYAQFEAKMLNYYKAELAKRGVSITSKNKADDFQKLQAIIQVVHDRIGLGERNAYDYTNFPTGTCNWFYGNNYNHTNGDYYNGTDYCPTIEFYGSCDIVADIEGYLAEQAGLPLYTLINNKGHVYVIIQANYVWYNADAWMYMYPGCNGLAYGGTLDPSTFTESAYDIGFKMSYATTESVTNGFKLKSVFYGTSDAITSDNCLLFGNVIGIQAENATYTSSDESVISFNNSAKTYTLHKAGTAYVTITYTNVKPGPYQNKYPTLTTTIRVKVSN